MRVLIVEDERKLAISLKEMLSEEGYAVDVLHDGEEGLNAAQFETYDLIILDRMLPGPLDGAEICRALRKADCHVPVLLLTAKDSIEDKVNGLRAGADDYLVKPFSFKELLARMQALLRRPPDMLGEVLTAGDLTMHTTSKMVQRQGRTIKLSAKEYALLEYLLRHKGEIVSKQQLIAHVWDFDADILPNTVESFMTFLRTKIEKPFSGPKLFHTIRGLGYKVGVSHEQTGKR